MQVSFSKAVSFHSGLIGLSKEQAKVRAGKVTEVEAGLYEIKPNQSIEFKAGEKVRLLEVPKIYRPFLDDKSEKIVSEHEENLIKSRLKAEAEAEEKAKAEAEAEEKPKKKAPAKKKK